MSDDWREFLKEVHEQNMEEIEKTKQRLKKIYDSDKVEDE